MNLEDTDIHHPDRAHGARGLLALFNAHGVLSPADVHVATQIAALTGEEREAAVLAAALTVRAARAGSVCLDLAGLPSASTAAEWDVPQEAWPDVDWPAHLAASPLVRAEPAPFHLDGTRLYLTRYWREETYVLGEVLKRVSAAELSHEARASLAAYFPGAAYADQRAAAAVAVRSRLSILTGGPGTGKTTTVARLLGVLYDADPEVRVALAAPTGKAAARMSEALAETVARADFPPTHRDRIAGLPATTIHRLLAYSPRRGYGHDENHPLPYDLVIIDETSMVSLTLMARLLAGVPRKARLVLAGDAHQLASVDVGVVLADLVEGLGGRAPNPVAELTATRRFGAHIRGLADAIRRGESEAALPLLAADAGGALPTVTAEQLPRLLLPVVREMHDAASAGDSRRALELAQTQQLLCAHRDGPHGMSTWNEKISGLLEADVGRRLGEWFPGTPLLVTRNDYGLRLFNGDTAVVVSREGRLMAAFPDGPGVREIPLSQLSDIVAAYAITVHRAQGSQFRRVYVLLPERSSRVLTRELLYTALTRAQDAVRVIGRQPVIEQAIARRVERASGLAQRLQRAGGPTG